MPATLHFESESEGDQMNIRSAICAMALTALLGCSHRVIRSNTGAEPLDCQNDEVELSPAVIVISPHPDDEILGFGGVIYEALKTGRRVRVVITTDGQRFCEACAFWKAGAASEEPCTSAELETFGDVRRQESMAALRAIGLDATAVTFLGYYDSTLELAWHDHRSTPTPTACGVRNADAVAKRVKTGDELVSDLTAVLNSEPTATSIFTTHPLDRHSDHAALYRFVLEAKAATGRQLHVYTAVLHSHGGTDCDYPLPRSGNADCVDGHAAFNPMTLTDRYLPDEIWRPPTDAEYGRPLIFCLDPSMYSGVTPLKRVAVETYRTQLGTTKRDAGPLDARYVGWTDRNGYLFSFVRRNEVFYLDPPVSGF
jgi:LmbE family N-acetylglucosaminyl deacetylase